MLKVVERISQFECVTLDPLTQVFVHWFLLPTGWQTCKSCGDRWQGNFVGQPVYVLEMIQTGCGDYKASQYGLRGVKGERYRGSKLIGKGGFGSVWKGTARSGWPVAIKSIQGKSVTERERNWKKELDTLVRINHPNIIKVFDAMVVGQDFYIVSELAKDDLQRIVQTVGPINDEDCLRAAKGLLDGLGHLHSLGLIHRDIKPQNVVLGIDDNIKFIDLGIAKMLDPGSEYAKTMIGTPGYFPPELLNGIGSTYQSDLYQLGMVLYFMRVGVPPIAPSLPVQVIYDQIRLGVPRQAAERMNCAPKLKKLISILLRRSLHLRFLTAADALNFVQHNVLAPNVNITSAV